MKYTQKLSWFWNRLKCMSALELAYRIYQKGLSTSQQYGFLTANTPPTPILKSACKKWLMIPTNIDLQPYIEKAQQISGGTITVFSENFTFTDNTPHWNYDASAGKQAPLVFGKNLDYRDSEQIGDIKYIWEPNRHLHLTTLSQASALTGNNKYLDTLIQQLALWFQQCLIC